MKLHLPVRLFRAVAALFSLGVGIASSCHISSAAVPEGYKEFIIVTEGDLTNMEPTLGNRAFLVKADLLFDKLSSPFMTGTAESWYFSCLPGVSVIFENATDGVFDVAASQLLTFTEFGAVGFNNNSAYNGGAIYGGNNSTIMLSGNGSLEFSDNTSSLYGGAIYGNSGSTIVLSENESIVFSGNKASSSSGGAIYGSMITLSENESVVFSENSVSSGSGGAICGASGGTIELRGNASLEFRGNTAYAGGAIYGITITLNDNVGVEFRGNTAKTGGAIETYSNVALSGNGSVTFSGNSASDSGGAIYGNSGSTIVLSENESIVFSGNKSSSYGGAIYGYTDSTVTLSGNESVTFSENTAKLGGAIYAYSNVDLSSNGSVTFSGNSASSYGGAIYGYRDSTIELSGNGSVTFSGNSASSSGGAIYALIDSAIELSGNGSVEFSGNSSSAAGGAIYGLGLASLNGNDSVVFRGNKASTSGGAISGRANSTITLSGNGSVEFSGNSASGYSYASGGAIDGSTIELSGNGSVVFNENTASGSGGAISGGTNSTITLSGNGSVEFSGNTSSASGGAISGASGSTIELSSNGKVTFSGNVTSSNAYYYGGAIQTGGNLSIRNNDKVLFEKNAYISNGAYYLRALYANGSEAEISLSAAAGGSIEFRDSVCIVSDLELNADYTDAAGVVHRQAGDIIFTGATTEADLLAVKGSAGTASEILNSWTSEIGGNINLYGGRLRVEDGAILALNGEVIVADNSDATLILKDGTLRGGINVASGGTLSLTGENIISMGNRNLTMADGSCLQMELGAVNMDGNAVLSTTGSLNMDYITFVLSDSEYLETGKYKLLTRKEGTDYDISGWTLQGAAANQLTWENGTLYYNGGHDWNHVVKGGDEVQDSYTGNLIVKDGSVTLDKSLTVNAVDGVEKTGHLVVDKANLTVTAESSVRAEVIVKDGTLHNEGSMEDSITLMGGKVSGSGVFAGIDMTGGKLVVGNSPGMQRYTDAVNLSGGTVVFSVAGAEAASAGNRGWVSATYSTLDMQGNILTFGEDVTIEVAFGGEGLVSVLTATDANPYTLQMSLAQNVGNAAAYTQEVLAALARQTTFVVTEEASGIAGCITLAPGQSLADIVKSYSYSMSGDTLVLSVTLAGNGKGVHAVPEPTTATLSLLALAALAARRRRK